MTGPLSVAEAREHRILLIDPASLSILASGPHSSARLPRIQIPTQTRITPFLHSALTANWGVRGTVLDYLSFDSGDSPCAVLELLSDKIPAIFREVGVDQLFEEDLSEDERASLLSVVEGKSVNALSRIGWLDEAIGWVEETAGQAIRSRLEIEQISAGGGFALLRFPMRNGQSYWLKATGHPNKHEQPLALLLSRFGSGHIPEVLATRDDWNAWVMSDIESPGIPADPIMRFHALERAVTAMAKLQSRLIGREAELFAAGAFDQRLSVLGADSRLLFERIEEAMALQTSMKASRLDGARLRYLRNRFVETCDLVESLGIPATALHGDMNVDNILCSDGSCQFVDWCETYVGYPLVTLQHLLLLNQPEEVPPKSAWDRILIERYRAAMSDICSAEDFERAVVCMPLIAAASALYGRGDWLRRSLEGMPQHQAWIRAMARHMERAAQQPVLLELLLREQAVCTG